LGRGKIFGEFYYGVYIKHLLKIYNKTKTTTKMINIFFDWIHKNVNSQKKYEFS
jgi:hypothetical protein